MEVTSISHSLASLQLVELLDRADITRIIHLTTRLDVEACLRQDDFHLIAKGSRLNRSVR